MTVEAEIDPRYWKVRAIVKGGKNTSKIAVRPSAGPHSATKVVMAAVSSALILSLITWYLFYQEGMPLNTADIAVVTGFWLAVVTMLKWLWKCFFAQRQRRNQQ
jgi:uncharacterized PurR-regulated membrane protein YhhQ (DUF165 family)